MRSLFISPFDPSDPSRYVVAICQRMSMFLKALTGLGSVDALFYVCDTTDTSPTAVAQVTRNIREQLGLQLKVRLCRRATLTQSSFYAEVAKGALSVSFQPSYSGFAQPLQLRALESALATRPDIVFAHRLQAMCPLLRTRADVPVFFDLDDIEHLKLFRMLRQPPHWTSKPLSYCLLPSLIFAECRAIRFAQRTFVCSNTDKAYLERWHGARISAIPNAVMIPNYSDPPRDPTLLFLGIYSYPPNARAAEFLLTRIWPLIKSAVPRATLLIAGADYERIRWPRDASDGVAFLGFVKDLHELYRRTRLVCCPILTGSGTRMKIVEAAAYGRAVVSTRIGAEGLELRDGVEILLRDEPTAFAQACIALLRDDHACRDIGLAARAAAQRLYDRRGIIKAIESEISYA